MTIKVPQNDNSLKTKKYSSGKAKNTSVLIIHIIFVKLPIGKVIFVQNLLDNLKLHNAFYFLIPSSSLLPVFPIASFQMSALLLIVLHSEILPVIYGFLGP